MIGLRFPRLFYGRKKRQQVVGIRADFCEFCVCVCRHEILSFQSAPTVFFVALAFEEYQRESRCEVCRTRFPFPLHGSFVRKAGANRLSIQELVTETNPGVAERTTAEVVEMVDRSGDPKLFERTRVVTFLQAHESEYRQQLRNFIPHSAVGSIQAMILGFALSLLVPFWLAIAFAGSLFVLSTLLYFIFLRSAVFRQFRGRLAPLQAVTRLSSKELQQAFTPFKNRFPAAISIFKRQLADLETGPLPQETYLADRDFLPLLERLTEP